MNSARKNSLFYGVLALITSLLMGILAGCSGVGSSGVCMASAQLQADGQCRAQRAPVHHLPFRQDYQTRVMQGYHGYLSHKEDLAFSLDFRCELGTPVVASRAGRVWDARKDSNRGCPDMSCVEDANYVIIDHGDGTFSEYYHLRQFGALVKPGEQVCAGQLIGLCGNTGFSTGAHLHFALTDATRRTMPGRFFEAQDAQDFGFAVPEAEYTSENKFVGTCEETSFSPLSRAAFAHQGIMLDETLPMVIEKRVEHEKSGGYAVRGTYFGEHPNVAVHRKALESGDWVDECVPVEKDGSFSAKVRWPADGFEAGSYWFMLSGADEDCLSPGWSWAYRIQLLD